MCDRLRQVGLALLMVLALVACGKAGSPEPPEDSPNTFPRVYPSR